MQAHAACFRGSVEYHTSNAADAARSAHRRRLGRALDDADAMLSLIFLLTFTQSRDFRSAFAMLLLRFAKMKRLFSSMPPPLYEEMLLRTIFAAIS